MTLPMLRWVAVFIGAALIITGLLCHLGGRERVGTILAVVGSVVFGGALMVHAAGIA